MKRLTRAAAIGLATATIAALAGCAADAAPPSSGSGEVVFWQHTAPARDAVVTELAGQFESEHEGTKVETQFIPYAQYFDKLIASLETGTGPDVFQVPEEMAEQLILAGVVEAVPDSVITTAEIDDSYLPAAISRWKHDGSYYGMPTDVQTGVLYTNVKLLEACGGDPAAIPTEWDAFADLARACTLRDEAGNITQAGLDTTKAWNLTAWTLYQGKPRTYFDAAACTVDLTGGDSVERWTRLADLVQGDNPVDSSEFLAGQAKFQSEKAVFRVGLPVDIGAMEQEFPNLDFVVSPLPTADDSATTFVRGWAYVVNAKAADKQRAWELVMKLSDADAQRMWFQKVGSLPATLAEIADESLATDENRAVALATLKGANPIQNISIKTSDAMNDLWTALSVTKAAPADALATAEKQVQGYVQETLGCTP